MCCQSVNTKNLVLVFQFRHEEVSLISSFSISETTLPESICYINNKIITVGNCSKTITQPKIKIRDSDTGNLLKEWNTCHAFLSLVPLKIQGKIYLLGACKTCRVIKGYDFALNTETFFTGNVTPSMVCPGPEDSILVLDEEKGFISQLRYSDGTCSVLCMFSVDPEYITGMCYSDMGGILAVLGGGFLKGISLVTKEMLWQKVLCNFGPTSLHFSEMISLPDGKICCVVDYEKLVVFNAADGAITDELFANGNLGRIWKVATYCGSEWNKMAVLHNAMDQTLITTYRLPHPYVPLRDIDFDEETTIEIRK